MARTEITWDPIFAHLVAHPEATLPEVAALFDVKPATLRPAVHHESRLPGGGRLAGHPVYGAKTPAVPQTAIDPATAAAVYVPIAELVPWARNPKKHDAETIAASIIRFGFTTAITARLETREIIAGHGRIGVALDMPRRWAKASPEARKAWHPEAVALATAAVPVLPVRYRVISEDEAHALALLDNQAGRLGGWDDDKLSGVLRELRARTTEVMGLGWDAAALAKLTGEGDAAGSRGRLPAGERSAVRKVTIEMFPEDAERLRRAIEIEKGGEDPAAPEHERTNGRRLGRVCAAFLAARGA